MLTFDELTNECKLALLEYFYMSCESVDDVKEKCKSSLFVFEKISIVEAKKRCMSFPFDCGEFTTFDEYHNWYVRGGDIPNYKNSMYPVIQGGCGEWLDDGWHRFHSYIVHKKEYIPVLSFV